MNCCFFYVMVMAVVIVQSAPHESKSSEMPYLPPVESPPEVIFYTYTPTDSGYNYSFQLSYSVYREETFEIKNKGTPQEETVVTGLYMFKGDDGYKYYVNYTIDKDGTHVVIDKAPIHRIPPSTLKSLVG